MKLKDQEIIKHLIWAQFFLHFLLFFILFLTIISPYTVPSFVKIYNYHVFDILKEELMLKKGFFPGLWGHIVLGLIILKLISYVLILLKKRLGIVLFFLIVITTFLLGLFDGDTLSIAWMRSIDYVSVTIDGMLLALLLFTDIKKKF